jgi:pimeloyl-ACP methyl ester carboxylesterase
VRDRDVVVRGLRLRVRERGEGAPCVLLHGWLDHLGSFDALAPQLPGRTIAYDARGHGDSAWAGPGGLYHIVD